MGYMGPEEFHELFFLAQLVAFFCGKNHDSPTEYLQLIGTKLVVLFDIFGGWRMVKHDETMVICNWILWTQWDFKINNGDWSTTTDLSIKHWVGSFQQRWGFKNQRMIELVSGGQWRGYNWPIGEQKNMTMVIQPNSLLSCRRYCKWWHVKMKHTTIQKAIKQARNKNSIMRSTIMNYPMNQQIPGWLLALPKSKQWTWTILPLRGDRPQKYYMTESIHPVGPGPRTDVALHTRSCTCCSYHGHDSFLFAASSVSTTWTLVTLSTSTSKLFQSNTTVTAN